MRRQHDRNPPERDRVAARAGDQRSARRADPRAVDVATLGRPLSDAAVLQLQRTVGNAAVVRMLQRTGQLVDTHQGKPDTPVAVQRMPAKKRKKGKHAATEAIDPPIATEAVDPLTAAIGYFAQRNPRFQGLAEKPNVQEDLLVHIGVLDNNRLPILSLDDIQADAEVYDRFLEAALDQPKSESGYDEPGGGQSKWAVGSIIRDHDRLREEYPYWGEATSLHHKISRDDLDQLLEAAKQDHAAAAPLFDFLKEIAAYIGSAQTNDSKLLWNMPANLEMGPAADTRAGDPGAGFDANLDSSGRQTPRSDALAKAKHMIGQDPMDWDTLVQYLREAHTEHVRIQAEPEKILTPPDKERWERGKGGKFTKV